MDLKKNDRLLFIGDSITDCGRNYPVGDSTVDGTLGNGYVSVVAASLTASHPQQAIRIMNTGISGNTVRDLNNRWDTDVSALDPDWLSIMIGINDVWQQVEGMWGMGAPISVAEYTATLSRLITRVRPRLSGLVLMTPYYLMPDRTDPMRRLMDEFGRAVMALAKEHHAIGIDTQAAFDDVMKHVSPLELAQDRVHVGLTGHTVLAQAFLKGIGYSWSK